MTTALITGASSGIGAIFAERLARRQTDVVLVARSTDKLQALADALSHQYGVQATVVSQDLTATDAVEHLWSVLEQQHLNVDVLVNNAGFGLYGEFAEANLDRCLQMIQLNVTTLVALTHRCLQGMRQRRSGCILNISSTAAFQPIPYFAVYAATKSFVLSFSEALWYECKPYGIQVIGVCPGPTDTAFFKQAQFPRLIKQRIAQTYASPESVVTEALKALDRGHSHVVTGGLMTQLLVNAGRLLPREFLTNNVGRLFGADPSAGER